MPPRAEVIADRPERLQESLRLVAGLELAHRPLPLARRLVRILRPIVESFVLAVLRPRQQLLDRWPVTAQLVRHGHARFVRIGRYQTAQEGLSRLFVAALLPQDVEDHTIRIHRSPQPIRLAMHGDAHLVQMPFALRLGATTAQFGSDRGAKSVAPAPDRLVGDEHTPLEHQLFYAAIAEREAEVVA